MAKSEWGVKRVCQSCAAKFYDLNRSPITCPKCAAPFDPEALLKSRRSRPPPAKPAKPEPTVSATADGAAADGATAEAGKPPEGDAKPDDDSGETASQSVDDSGETASQSVDDSGETASQSADDSGKTAGQSADDEDDASVLQDTSELGDDDAIKVVSTGDDD